MRDLTLWQTELLNPAPAVSDWGADWSKECLQSLQEWFASGHRCWSIALPDLEPGAFDWPPLKQSRQWSERFVRQTGGMCLFAWLDLAIEPWSEAVALAFELDSIPVEWGGTGETFWHDPEFLYVVPGILKGFVEGSRLRQLRDFKLKIQGMRIHPVDSRPLAFAACLRQAIAGLNKH